MKAEVRPHPHGGFTIARPVSRTSTARVYHGHFSTADEAQGSALFRQLGQEDYARSPLEHKARATQLLELASRMVKRAEEFRVQAAQFNHDAEGKWWRWMKRSVQAHSAAVRLIRWADLAEFEAMKARLA